MGYKILVVDDEPDVVELVSFNLRKNGYLVEQAYDGLQALNKARAVLPDLIVLDLMLPELDGRAVCEILRRLPSTASIPVLMLTACSTNAAKTIACKAGVDDYVTKPFSPQDLVSRVESVLARRRDVTQSDLD